MVVFGVSVPQFCAFDTPCLAVSVGPRLMSHRVIFPSFSCDMILSSMNEDDSVGRAGRGDNI